jgi:hypothetical protein
VGAFLNPEKRIQLSNRILSIFPFFLLMVPLALYSWQVFQYAVNVPFWDDYSILSFVNQFLEVETVGERLKLLFAQHNEHRLVFDRIVFLVQYFRWLIIFGDLGWILAVILLVYGVKKVFHLPWLYTVPVPYILLTVTHWEAMFFATPSLQFYFSMLFSIGLFLCLSLGKYAHSAILFPVILFTSGSGIVLHPLGNAFLFLRKRWKGLLLYLVSSTVFTLAYLFRYQSNPYHPTVSGSLMELETAITYFFVFLGSAMQSIETALCVGLLSSVLLVAIVVQPGVHGFLRLMAGFILLTAATGALTRSGFGLDQALASRYTTYSLLSWACIYLWLITSVKTSVLANRVLLVGLALGMVCFFGMLLKVELTHQFAQTKAERINGLALFVSGDPSKLSYPNPARPAQVLSTAEELGVFDPRDGVTRSRPIELEPSTIRSSAVFKGFVDEYDGSCISGWALIPKASAMESRISIMLTDGDKTLKLGTFRQKRPDVSEAFDLQFRYDFSGYKAFIATYEIPPGIYKIGILVESGDEKALEWEELEYSAP